MTQQEIDDLKREHNRLQQHGRRAYAEVAEIFRKCIDLRERIQKAEGYDYDPIPLLFGGGFYVDPK